MVESEHCLKIGNPDLSVQSINQNAIKMQHDQFLTRNIHGCPFFVVLFLLFYFTGPVQVSPMVSQQSDHIEMAQLCSQKQQLNDLA